MASRYHWISTGASGFFAGGTLITPMTLSFPAGAQMKRWLINEVNIRGRNQGANINYFQPIGIVYQVKILTGANAGRIIWSAYRRLHCQPIFTSTIPVQYILLMHGTDLDLGVNEKSTYGKATEGAWDLELRMLISPEGATPGLATGDYNVQFKALYYL